jgi:hypothetical protein
MEQNATIFFISLGTIIVFAPSFKSIVRLLVHSHPIALGLEHHENQTFTHACMHARTSLQQSAHH